MMNVTTCIRASAVASEPYGEGAVLFIDIVDINDNDFHGSGGA